MYEKKKSMASVKMPVVQYGNMKGSRETTTSLPQEHILPTIVPIAFV